MSTVCDFIDNNFHPETGRLLIHCEMGISRSTTMLIAYLMRKQGRSRDEVLAEVKAKWTRTRLNKSFMAQLEVWEKVRYNVWRDESKMVPKMEYQVLKEARGLKPVWKKISGKKLQQNPNPLSLISAERRALRLHIAGSLFFEIEIYLHFQYTIHITSLTVLTDNSNSAIRALYKRQSNASRIPFHVPLTMSYSLLHPSFPRPNFRKLSNTRQSQVSNVRLRNSQATLHQLAEQQDRLLPSIGRIGGIVGLVLWR